jgi:FkbH-like protein
MLDTDLLHWLPKPRDVKAEILSANASDGDDRLARYLQIAEQRLDYFACMQLDRALRQAFPEGHAVLTRIRLALLADMTVEHLIPAIRVAGLRRRIGIDTYVGGFGQLRQELEDQNSGLHAFQPDVVLFAPDPRKEFASLPLGTTPEDVSLCLGRWIEELRGLWHIARDDLGATILQETCINAAPPVFGDYDAQVPAAPATLAARWNDVLRNSAGRESVILLDVARTSERLGTSRWVDVARWHQAKQVIAPEMAPLYGDLVARLLAAQRGMGRKCLVLDLDNTLWGGVVGDDGINGIILGQGNAVGEAHAAFQRYAKSLTERGVILAVCSKNNPEIVETVFRDHPEMVLTRNDIAAFAVNWTDKPANLREIAKNLNIGLDSLVFFDDNPFEREMVRRALPMVAVPEVPEDCARYVQCLSEAGYFEALSFTDEDRKRVRSYAANAERERMRGEASNTGEFLRGLDMRLKAGPFAPVDIPRVTQLINKTNQFNVTTKRYSQHEVTALASEPHALTLQARLTDRLGDNGLISVVILRNGTDDPGTLTVDTWLMSCRVLGRGVEQELNNLVVEAAVKRGAERIIAMYQPTPKNALVRDLFANLGYRPAGANGQGATFWELQVSDYQPHQTHIVREQ